MYSSFYDIVGNYTEFRMEKFLLKNGQGKHKDICFVAFLDTNFVTSISLLAFSGLSPLPGMKPMQSA